MRCSRSRLVSCPSVHPVGRLSAMRLISTWLSQDTPTRCLSDNIKRSRWLSTGQTGTHEPHIMHSCVKRATCAVTSSLTVAWLRSAIFTSDDIGTGQASIQRSQPIHISISKRMRSPVNACTSPRCSISPPTVVGMEHRGDVQALTGGRIRLGIVMCIGCDRCMDACPVPMSSLVNIADLNHATVSDDVTAHVERFTHECIMCGSCVPVCPVDNHRDLLMLSLKQRVGVSWDNQVDMSRIAESLPTGWTLGQLTSRLREHRILSDAQLVPENYLLHVVAASSLRILMPGDTAIREGEYGRELHLILEGRLAVYASEAGDSRFPIAILRRGEHVGEDGMLTGQPYKVTAQAQAPTLVLQVPEQAMQLLMELVPNVRAYFDQVNNARSMKSILKRMALFQGVSDADLQALIKQTPVKQYERNERLFAEDDQAGRPARETLHILLEGFVKVARHTTVGTGHHKSDERIIAYRQGGDYFAGGLDLLGEGRAVSVSAINRVREAEG